MVQAVPDGHPERGQDQRQDLRGERRREQQRHLLRQGDPAKGRDQTAVAAEELAGHHHGRQGDQEGRAEGDSAVAERWNGRRSQRRRLRHLEPARRVRARRRSRRRAARWWLAARDSCRRSNFYHTVFADGLGAPTSQLFSPNNAPNIPSADFAKGTLGIAVGANFIGGNWTKQVSFPYWSKASTAMGVAGLPTASGKGYASTLEWLGLRHFVGATAAQATAAIELLEHCPGVRPT